MSFGYVRGRRFALASSPRLDICLCPPPSQALLPRLTHGRARLRGTSFIASNPATFPCEFVSRGMPLTVSSDSVPRVDTAS